MRLAAKGSETYQGCGRKFTDHKQKINSNIITDLFMETTDKP